MARKLLLLYVKIRIRDSRIEDFYATPGVTQGEFFFEDCRPGVRLLHPFAKGRRVSEHQDPVASRGLILGIVVAISQTEVIDSDRRSTGDTLTAWQKPGQRGAVILPRRHLSLVYVVAGVAVGKRRKEGSLLLGLGEKQRQIEQQDGEHTPAKQRQEPRGQETRLRRIRRHKRNLAGLALLSCLLGCKGAPRDMAPPDDSRDQPIEAETDKRLQEGEQSGEGPVDEHPEAVRQGGRVEPSEDEIVEHWEDEYFPFIDYVNEAPFDAPGPLKTRSEPVDLADELLIERGVATIGDESIPGARPVHSVTLKSYYIDRYEVSNLRYQEFVRATERDTPYVHENWAAIYNWFRDSHPKGLAEVPVVMVTWNDADAFCRWAGRRLPTEYEWERAARGSEAKPYPWGATFNSQKANLASRLSGPLKDRDAWDRFEKSWTGSKKPEIAIVGSYPEDRSADGVMDMAGNVNEWVAGYFVAYPKADRNERKGLDEKLRVARGNSWGNRDYSSSMAVRYPYREDRVDSLIGFRCARDAE
jgi:formylglycine-generating enzyme